MSKLVVSANSMKHLEKLISMRIDGIILSIEKLAVNASFYVNINEIKDMDFNEKEVFVSLNKIMHNMDLDYLREVLNELKDMSVRILFYDMAVYRIAKELGIVDRLVIYQDHLNTSILSNRFYNNLGIRGSYISSDITGEELLEIKENSNMEIFFTGYGYLPIFYSRRYLVSNYLDYIHENKGDEYKIISDTGVEYPIEEEEFGTTIYTKREVNLINYLDYLDKVDYIVMHSNMIDDDEFNSMVLKFINRDKVDNCYLGFFKIRTIYKVK